MAAGADRMTWGTEVVEGPDALLRIGFIGGQRQRCGGLCKAQSRAHNLTHNLTEHFESTLTLAMHPT